MNKVKYVRWIGNVDFVKEVLGLEDSITVDKDLNLIITNKTGSVCTCPLDSIVGKTEGTLGSSYHFEKCGEDS